MQIQSSQFPPQIQTKIEKFNNM